MKVSERNSKDMEPIKQSKTPELLTVKQAAQILNMGSGTLYNWIYKNCCPIRVKRINGKMIRFSRRDVEEYIRNL